MRKTINRLSKESIIAVHDNLLANLYELDLNNISSKNIDEVESFLSKNLEKIKKLHDFS